MRPSCTVSTSFAISTSLRAARSGLAKGLFSTNFMVRVIAAFNWMGEYRHATRPRIGYAFDTSHWTWLVANGVEAGSGVLPIRPNISSGDRQALLDEVGLDIRQCTRAHLLFDSFANHSIVLAL